MGEKKKDNKLLSSQIHKVFLLIFIFGCLFSLILFIPSEISKFKAFIDRIDELIITLIESKKGRIAFDIYMENDVALTQQLKDFLNFHDVLGVDLFDSKGSFLKSTQTKESYSLDTCLADSIENKSSVQYNLFKGAYLEYTSKLSVAGETTGYMKLYYSIEKIIRQTVIFAILILALILIIFFIYMLLIDRLLKRVVTNPLVILGRGMQEIEKGNLGFQISVKTGNEIDVITQMFNKMSYENKELYERINHMNRTLENKVAQRTEELNQKNLSLEKAKAEAEKLALEAKQANKAKSEFLANLSHEIRTPLNGVIGFSELLAGTSLNEMQYKYVDNIEKSADVLLGLISDILDLSKIEAGKLELEYIETDVKKLIRETVDILDYQAQKKGLKLNMIIENEMPQFGLFDPVRLKQVLVNLIGNAVKFTERGLVEMIVNFKAVNEKTGSFGFKVKDTGIGISKEQKNRLFKAFSQADTSITRKYGGTGLGLVISNMLLNKMGSALTVESEPGSGSSFSFTIITEYSTVKEIVQEVEPEKKSMQIISGTPKILIAEDVSINRELIKNLLEKMIPKAQLSFAKDGEEAAEKAINEHYNLILMDIQMPKMSGLEATQTIRKNERHKQINVPIIALTAEVMNETVEKVKAAGMDDFLSKPIKYKDLNEMMLKYLKQSKMEVEKKDTDQKEYLALNLYGVNFKEGIERLMGDKQAYLRILESFIADTQEDIKDFEKAVQMNHKEVMKSVAHKIKGTAGNLAVFILEEKAAQFEQALIKENDASYRELFYHLKAEFEKFTESFLQTHRNM